MRTVYLVLLLLALLALLVFMIVVIIDRLEDHVHLQPEYYAALSPAGSAEGRVEAPGSSSGSILSPTLERFLFYAEF